MFYTHYMYKNCWIAFSCVDITSLIMTKYLMSASRHIVPVRQQI